MSNKTLWTPGPRNVQHRGDLGVYHSLAEGGATIGVFSNRADAELDAAAPQMAELLAGLMREVEENPTGLDMVRYCNSARALLARIGAP